MPLEPFPHIWSEFLYSCSHFSSLPPIYTPFLHLWREERIQKDQELVQSFLSQCHQGCSQGQFLTVDTTSQTGCGRQAQIRWLTSLQWNSDVQPFDSISHNHGIKQFWRYTEEKGTSWTLLIITNIWLWHLVKGYLENNICYFRTTISPWRGPQVKSLFRTFFFGMVYIFTIQKISLDWGPL